MLFLFLIICFINNKKFTLILNLFIYYNGFNVQLVDLIQKIVIFFILSFFLLKN